MGINSLSTLSFRLPRHLVQKPTLSDVWLSDIGKLLAGVDIGALAINGHVVHLSLIVGLMQGYNTLVIELPFVADVSSAHRVSSY